MKNTVKEWIKTILAAIIIALLVSVVIQPVVVDGRSMLPTLEDGNYLIVSKLGYKITSPSKGDIIVAETDNLSNDGKSKKIVKRVIGLPNDHIVVKNGSVYLNDKKLNENYIKDSYTDGSVDIIVPKNEVFVMGDNRLESQDSRAISLGTINKSDILGKVVIRLFPFNKITTF